MKTTSRKSQNPVGQPAVQSLSRQGSRNAKAAEKEEDEMMSETGKGLWDNGLGISTEDSGQNGDYGNEQGGDGEGNRFGEPEDGSEGEDCETRADLRCGMGGGILDRQEPVDEGKRRESRPDRKALELARSSGFAGLLLPDGGFFIVGHFLLLRENGLDGQA